MTSREWNSLADNVVEAIRNAQADAPVRLSEIAATFNIRLIAATLPAGISGEIRPDPDGQFAYLIKVNRHDAKTRQRFTIAHELAHFFLHEDEIGDGIVDDVLYRSKVSSAREAQANRLAADILIPKNLLNQEIETARLLKVDKPLDYLTSKFRVSEAAMKIRLGID